MGDYQTSIDTLASELGQVERAFRGLSETDWTMLTRLVREKTHHRPPPWRPRLRSTAA